MHIEPLTGETLNASLQAHRPDSTTPAVQVKGPAVAKPYLVGVLNDMSDDAASSPGSAERFLRLPIEAIAATGRLDREVEFINSYGLGLPTGTAAAVERAYRELVDADVLLIVGPAIGDDALVATPLAEKYRVPTINWAGTERARSEYMFHLQVGSHEDESLVIARHLSAQGARRLGVVYDQSPIGRRHLAFLQDEASLLGIDIVSTAAVSPLADNASREVAQVLSANPDGLVYLGLGLCIPAVMAAIRDAGFDGPRALNTAGMRGYAPDFGRVLDGWAYIDMHSDENQTLAAVRRQLGDADRPGPGAAYGYDLGQLVGEGLARAPERTRDGVKDGLEQIKWLAAAEGYEGTLLGFGNHDRGALHGRYLVVRQWRDGRSVQL
jgi:branched-chain amino acid transport system substrate-binding protein